MITAIRLNQSGATAIEYCLILALIAIGMVVGLTAMTNATNDMWRMVTTRVSEVLGS